MKDNTNIVTATEFYSARLKHPLIDGLTPLPTDFTAMSHELEYFPPAPDETVRAKPSNERLRLTSVLRELHIPSNRDVSLAYQIDQLIRTGYEARPLSALHYATSKDRIAGLVDSVMNGNCAAKIQAPCASLIARSGEGKSRACQRVLQRYKQVLLHDTQANPLLPAKQVVALLLECPSDRTISSLVVEFVAKLEKAIGEKIPARFKQGNRSTLISNLAELCETYWVGLIVLDECQHGLHNGLPAVQFMNFLVEMSNKLCVPILYVGTPAALKLIGGQLRQARRMLGIQWVAFQATDPEFRRFIEKIWPYQFTKTFTPLDLTLIKVIYDYSQGIPVFAIVLYEFAQRYAIAAATDEVLSTDHLTAVYEDLFGPVHPMLEALASGEKDRIAEFEDLAYHDETTAWFKGLAKLRESLRMKAVSRVTNAHKRAIKTMVKSAGAEADIFARLNANQGGSGESLIQILMAAKQLGLDPSAVLKEATANAQKKGAA